MVEDIDLKQRIRERAYQIWLEEGKPSGRDLAHWELAKAEIAAKTTTKEGEKPPVPGPYENVN